MDYELAKELKDAGFPQDINEEFRQSPGTFYRPTLEELIEAVDSYNLVLRKTSEGWWCGTGGITTQEIITTSPTPTEAVARLWLALRKKTL